MPMKDLSTATGSAESQGGGVLIHLTTPAYLLCCSLYSGLFVKVFKIELTLCQCQDGWMQT